MRPTYPQDADVVGRIPWRCPGRGPLPDTPTPHRILPPPRAGTRHRLHALYAAEVARQRTAARSFAPSSAAVPLPRGDVSGGRPLGGGDTAGVPLRAAAMRAASVRIPAVVNGYHNWGGGCVQLWEF